MIHKQIIGILRAGPEISRAPKAPETNIPLVIEVETTIGPVIFQIGPQAAAVLSEELESYMRLYSTPAA